MKDLMIHVERIVRPVRAMQFRKLRMRRELLAHLQAAFDEERAAGADDATARQRAEERLGDPAELTRTLQQTVPWIERTLMARVPGSRTIDRMERFSPRVFGLDRNITMFHSAIIVLGATFLAYMALLFAVLALSPRDMLFAMFHNPPAAIAMNLIYIAAILVLVCTASTFMFEISRSKPLGPQWWRIAIILLMPSITMATVIAFVSRGAPPPAEAARGLITGVALLLTTMSLAHIVARLRQPYDPWLTLDVAG